MRPRARSYADSSILTRSPGFMRILNRRILPAVYPSVSWPLSSAMRNMPFRSASTISPVISTFSSFWAMVASLVLRKMSAAGARPAALKCLSLELRENGDVRGLRALLTLLGLELDLCALGQRPVAAALDRAEVHEQVLTAVVRRDEPVALVCVEPLDGSGCHICIHLPANFSERT